jgi:PIN domain nuclease of toxin-antitoxin system
MPMSEGSGSEASGAAGSGPRATPILLDTHVWIWVVEGSRDRLSPEAVTRIQEASGAGEVLVSAISVWEVSMLASAGRISLARSLDDWVKAALRAPGVRFLELTPEIARESTRLPEGPGGDPADRILMAGARVTGAVLATADRRIVSYGKRGHLAVMDVRP